MRVQRGFVRSLKARIPWTKLTEKPVIVQISGLAVRAAATLLLAALFSRGFFFVHATVLTACGAPLPPQTQLEIIPNSSYVPSTSELAEELTPADQETYTGRVRQAVMDNIQVRRPASLDFF